MVRKSKKKKGNTRTKKRVSGMKIILVMTARGGRVRKKNWKRNEEKRRERVMDSDGIMGGSQIIRGNWLESKNERSKYVNKIKSRVREIENGVQKR